MLTPLRLFLVLGLPLALPACAQSGGRRAASPMSAAVQTETFKLSASPCAAKGYPMTIQIGAFVRSDGKTFPVPSGHFLLGEWGHSSIGWAVGDENQPAPASLEILYFSYTEDKFYEGRFALPQQRLHELLKAGFWNTDDKRHDTYDELTVCVLPKGVVCIWLTGIGRQVFIGRFQGSVSDADFKQFYPKTDRANMYQSERAERPAEVQRQMEAGTVNSKKWDDYLKNYTWQVAFSTPLTLSTYRISYLNAELTNYPATANLDAYVRELLTTQARAVPRSLALQVRDEASHAHRLRIKSFDETETMAAFASLSQTAPAHPLTLRVETDKYVKKATLVLTDGTRTIPLTKTAVEVLSQ